MSTKDVDTPHPLRFSRSKSTVSFNIIGVRCRSEEGQELEVVGAGEGGGRVAWSALGRSINREISESHANDRGVPLL